MRNISLESFLKEEIDSALLELEGWKRVKNLDAIEKIYNFVNFKIAFDFMALVAEKAEELNHHPEWSNNYSTVRVRLTTHDASGVTKLDIELAHSMERIFKNLDKNNL